MEVIVTFLAMLELVKMRAIRIWQEEVTGPIVLGLAAPLEEVQQKIATEEIEGDGDGA